MDKGDNMRTSPFPGRLRDVADVAEYVLGAVQHAAPAAGDRRRAMLQAHGVLAVQRVERALPPGVPLRPVLESVLEGRLVALDRGLSRAEHQAAA
jgi:hypothetical protein